MHLEKFNPSVVDKKWQEYWKNNNTFQAFSKTYMRLVQEMKAGREFKVAPIEEADAFEPVDINLLEKLRKKYDL